MTSQAWDEKLFVENLCKHRCYDRNFGGIQSNGRWPTVSDPTGTLKCTAECKVIYKSLLNKVAKVLPESDEKDQVRKAIRVVRSAIEQRLEKAAKKGATRTRGPKGSADEPLRMQLFRSQLRNKEAPKEKPL